MKFWARVSKHVEEVVYNPLAFEDIILDLSSCRLSCHLLDELRQRFRLAQCVLVQPDQVQLAAALARPLFILGCGLEWSLFY